MAFQIGETVVCSITIRDAGGNLVEPSTSITISIRKKRGARVVTDQAMTPNGTGIYHYDFDSSGNTAGTYVVDYKAVNGTRVTMHRDTFELE